MTGRPWAGGELTLPGAAGRGRRVTLAVGVEAGGRKNICVRVAPLENYDLRRQWTAAVLETCHTRTWSYY